MDACFCSALMASPGVLFVSAHPDSSIIVFVNVSSKTSSSSTQKQANDIHMAVAIFCSITLNSTVGGQRHPRLFSSQISHRPVSLVCLNKGTWKSCEKSFGMNDY